MEHRERTNRGGALTARITATITAISICMCACGSQALFQPPPKGTPEIGDLPPSESTLSLVATLPFSVIQKTADDQTSKPFSFSGSNHLACANVPYVVGPHVGSHQQCANVPYLDFRGAGTQRQCVNVPDFYGPSVGSNSQCVDFNWHATAAREGNIAVTKSGPAVHVEVPVRIDGQGGLSGTLAQILSLSAKNVEVHAKPAVDLTFNMDSKWCPVIKVTPTNNWVSSATVEVIGKNCIGVDLGALGHPQLCAGPADIDLANVANGAIASHQNELTSAAQASLSCNAVQSAVKAQWRSLSIPVKQIQTSNIFINITPTAAAFSGLIAEDNDVKMIVQVKAKTQVESSAVPESLMPLPDLGQTTSDVGGLNLHVKVLAPYDALTQAMSKEIKGKNFSKATKAGNITIHVEDVQVYPSQSSLAVGVEIRAKLPGRFFDTTGWVYLVGKPKVGPLGASIDVEDLHYAVIVNNDWWSLVADLFNSQVLAVLRSHSSIDLTSSLHDAETRISAAVGAASVPGVKIQAGTPKMSLESISIAPSSLVASAHLVMNFGVELTEGLVPH